ncbi:MAG: PAS domain S-box protein [Candidatus Bathyarchaeia archaeon]
MIEKKRGKMTKRNLNVRESGLALSTHEGRSRLLLIISICFAAVAAISAFGTLAWVTGQLTLAQINPLFVPIAPLAILLLVLLGASWFLYGVRPEYSIPVGVVGVLVVMLTSLTIFHAVMPGSFSIERLMFSNPATMSGYLLVDMSPIAAVMFFLGGLSLILLVPFSGTRTRTGIALFGMAIFSCGVVTSIGYLYQTPLLYGSPTRPVSVLAGIAFLFLGTEMWAAAGRECWPTRSLVGDSVQARLLRAFLPAGALIMLALLGLDQIIGNIYPPSLVASLDLLGAFVAVIVIVGGVSRGIGGEVDRGIAERVRMEKAVKESEEKYRAMVENSPNMVGIFQDGALRYINSVAIVKLGWTYEELASPSFDPIERVVSQKSRSLLKENVDRRLRGEDVATYEISLTKKDGSEVPVWVRGAKIFYEGKPAVQFSFGDMTERKRAEEKLRQSEERYHSLFERMLDGVYLSTHEGRFVDVNDAFVRMFRYSSKKEMLDITDIKKELYFSPEERGSHILDTRQEEVEAYRMRRKDGSEVWVEDHGRYVHDEQGNIVYHEGILRDITERKRLEEELKQYSLHLEELVEERTRKLHESEAELVKSQRLAAIGETAAMVGHDLRNPLQGITGALHLLKQESLTVEKRKEMLQVIEKSVHYSDAIVKDLSDYAAEIKLKPVEATPRLITRDAIGAVKVPQNVRVQDLSEDQPTLRVDPDMMKRVFVNLIENAIDAMPQGGTLTVSSKKSDGNVEIAFTDTGSGISEKVMENLWKPLQTTKAKGMGLGLAICKRIIDAHGGSMSVKSEVGQGTTLTIQLPLSTVEVKQK